MGNAVGQMESKPPRKKSFPYLSLLPLGLFGIGLVLIALQFVINFGSYVLALFMPVDHPATYNFARFDLVLRHYVKGNLVDYRALKRSGDLEPVVNELKRISPDELVDMSQDLAYWINSYNLLVLKDIVDNYPVESIGEIQPSLHLRKFIVGGKPYSIEDVLRNKLEPLLMSLDARAVFLICGGAMGYPPLQDHAIQPSHLEEDMAKASYDFINYPGNAYLDPDTNTFCLSHFFQLYAMLFSKSFGSPAFFVNSYLAPDKRVSLQDKHLRIKYIKEFDWRLNDTALKRLERDGAGTGGSAPVGDRSKASP